MVVIRPGIMWLIALLLLLPGCLENRGPQKLPISKGRNSRQEVAIRQAWTGEIPRVLCETLKQTRCIETQQEWSEAWKQLQRRDPLPEVNFGESLILMAINNNSSKMELEITLDYAGELFCTINSTPAEAPNPQSCTYMFAMIKREGIRSFESKGLASASCGE
jgi:hypothetical protein